MDIREYRRQLERKIAKEEAVAAEPRWEAGLESVGADDVVGPASGGADEAERLRAVLEDRGAADELRVEALGGLVARHDEVATAHEEALRLLADEAEGARLRGAALRILKTLSFHSPTTEDWKPDFLEALRRAGESDDPGLRLAAFEVLAVHRDRQTQALLLRGLEEPAEARIAPEQALRLLAHDPHSGVIEVARAQADARPNDAVHLEALRALAGDSDSVDRFRALLADGGESPAARKIAATALSSLDREALRAVSAELAEPSGLESMDEPSVGEEHVLRHVEALLDLPG